MADKKISALPAAAALNGSEQVPVVQNGATVRTSVDDILGELIGTYVAIDGLTLNVKDHGVTGDGTTDDTAAIQTLLTAVSSSPYHTTIFFPPGVYVTSGLAVKSNTTLQGAGSGGFGLSSFWGTRCSVLKHKASSTLPLIGDTDASTPAYSVIIKDLQLDGNKSNQSNSVHGIQLYDAASGQDPVWTVERCLIRNVKADGINQGTFRRGLRVLNTQVSLCDGKGISLGATDNTIQSTMIGQCAGVGLYISASLQHVIGCDIFSNLVGIQITSTAFSVMITNTGIDLNQHQGILCAGPRNSFIGCRLGTNGIATDNTYADIDLDFPNLTAINCSVIACSFDYDSTASANKASYGVYANLGVNIIGLMFNPSSSPFGTGAINSNSFLQLLNRAGGFADGAFLNLGTTTGSQIATTTSQKLGFWGVTPIVQPSSGTALRTALQNVGLLPSGGANVLAVADADIASTISQSKVTSLTTDLAAKATLINPDGLGIVYGTDPRYPGGVTVWPGANRGLYVRTINGGTITKIGLEVGVQSGNISVAVYRNSGSGRSAVPSGAPAITSGAVACPASGYAEVSLGGSVVVNPGDWLFLSCDNTTASFQRHTTTSGTALQSGFVTRQDSAHPAPTVGTLTVTAYTPCLLGVA